MQYLDRNGDSLRPPRRVALPGGRDADIIGYRPDGQIIVRYDDGTTTTVWPSTTESVGRIEPTTIIGTGEGNPPVII